MAAVMLRHTKVTATEQVSELASLIKACYDFYVAANISFGNLGAVPIVAALGAIVFSFIQRPFCKW